MDKTVKFDQMLPGFCLRIVGLVKERVQLVPFNALSVVKANSSVIWSRKFVESAIGLIQNAELIGERAQN
jgi:hypothetical protein